MRTLCDALNMRILFIDEEGRGTGRFVSMDPSRSKEDELVVLMLLRTRRQHLNLVEYMNKSRIEDVPAHVFQKWSLRGKKIQQKEEAFEIRCAAKRDTARVVSLVNKAYESEKVKYDHVPRTNTAEISAIVEQTSREFLLLAVDKASGDLAGSVLVRDVDRETAYFGTLSRFPYYLCASRHDRDKESSV